MKEINNIKMYSTAELAELLDVTPRTISAMRYNGTLPFTRIGKCMYTSEAALTDYLNGRTTAIALRKKKNGE